MIRSTATPRSPSDMGLFDSIKKTTDNPDRRYTSVGE